MNNKDLIKQYVDTGRKLPVPQIAALPPWALKTYWRKRFIAFDNNMDTFFDDEYALIPEELKQKFLEDSVFKHHTLSEKQYNDIKEPYTKFYYAEFGKRLKPYQFEELPEPVQKKHLQELINMVHFPQDIDKYFYSKLNDEQKYHLLSNIKHITSYQLDLTSEEVLIKLVQIVRDFHLQDTQFERLSDNVKWIYLESAVKHDRYVSNPKVGSISQELRDRFFNLLIDKDWTLSQQQLQMASPEIIAKANQLLKKKYE